MTKTRILLFTALVLAAMTGWLSPSSAEGKQTFSGTYDWSNGGSDNITAEFMPDGEGKWDVRFKFDFSGKSNTWKGTAEGSLEEGSELSGTASWDRNGRRWVFEATLVDGVLNGEHAEVRDGKQSSSGTFSLSR